MIKRISTLVMFVLFAGILSFGSNLSYQKGWQIRGYGGFSTNIDPSYILFNNHTISSLWAYQDNQWHKSRIQEAGSDNGGLLGIQYIKNNEGFWIQATNSGDIKLNYGTTSVIEPNFMNLKEGWHMYGYGYEISSVSFSDSSIDIVWIYNNVSKKWSAYSPKEDIKNAILNLGVPFIETISKNQGFWVKSQSDIQKVDIVSPDAPKLSDTSLNCIEGYSIQDASIGTVVVTDHKDEIESFAISGDGSELFKISGTNVIVKDLSGIDFANKILYKLKIKAHSNKGDSNTANLYIYISPKSYKRLKPSSEKQYDRFGEKLLFDNEDLIVGTPYADEAGYNAGKVSIFKALDSTNLVETTLESSHGYPSTYDYFGASLNLSGDILSIGLPGRRQSPYQKAGEVQLYNKQSDGSYKYYSYLSVDDTADYSYFGGVIASNDNFILVSQRGKIDVFKKSNLSLVSTITIPGVNPIKYDISYFKPLVMNGDNFCIGDLHSIYYYKLDSNGDAKLVNTVEFLQGNRVLDVAMDENYLGVVISKKLYLFDRKDGNISLVSSVEKPLSYAFSDYNTTTHLYSNDGNFDKITIKNSLIAASSHEEDQMASASNMGSGSVYLYKISNDGNISLQRKYTSFSSDFGTSMALSSQYLAIGAPTEATYGGSGTDYLGSTGAVYLYKINP